MRHRSYSLLAGILVVGLAGIIMGFAQAKDVVIPAHSQTVTSLTNSAPDTPTLDRCGEPLPASEMSVDPGTAGAPDMTPASCLRCATMLGFCDEMPDGAACGIHASCHGICTTCNGKRDCFSQN